MAHCNNTEVSNAISKIVSAEFLWFINFTSFQPFTKIFQQKNLTHDTVFMLTARASMGLTS